MNPILLICGIAVMAIGIRIFWTGIERARVLEVGQACDAKIMDKKFEEGSEEIPPHYVVRYRYKVDGQAHGGVTKIQPHKFDPKSRTIPVLYDPESPSRSEVAGASPAVAYLGAALLIFVLGPLFLLLGMKIPL